MRRIAALILLFALVVSLAACTPSERSVNGFSMGSEYYVEYSSSLSVDDLIRKELSRIEEGFSVREAGSVVYRINQAAAGEKIILSEDEAEIFRQVFSLAEASEGAFSPALYPLVRLWGFTSPDYEMNGKKPPDPSAISEARSLCDLDIFSFLESEPAIVKSEAGASLDLGGALKGYAAERIRDILIENEASEGLVYVGGTIAAVGRDYAIGVTAPRESEEDYAFRFTLKEGEICATSGDYERFYFYEGKRYHHILNGQTGCPSESGVISATVISQDGLLADSLATAVVVLGVEKGSILLQKLGAKGILVTEEKKVVTIGVDVTIKDHSYEIC